MKTVSNSILPDQVYETTKDFTLAPAGEDVIEEPIIKKSNRTANNKTRPDIGIRAKRNKVKKKQQKLARRLNRK